MSNLLPDVTPFDGVPYVGCAVTVPCGSDSWPGTVVWVSPQTVSVRSRPGAGGRELEVPKRIRVKDDRYWVVRGSMQDGSAEFEYDDGGPDSRIAEYSYRDQRKGYVRVGTPSRSTAAQRLAFGRRRRYYDPHF